MTKRRVALLLLLFQAIACVVFAFTLTSSDVRRETNGNFVWVTWTPTIDPEEPTSTPTGPCSAPDVVEDKLIYWTRFPPHGGYRAYEVPYMGRFTLILNGDLAILMAGPVETQKEITRYQLTEGEFKAIEFRVSTDYGEVAYGPIYLYRCEERYWLSDELANMTVPPMPASGVNG